MDKSVLKIENFRESWDMKQEKRGFIVFVKSLDSGNMGLDIKLKKTDKEEWIKIYRI